MQLHSIVFNCIQLYSNCIQIVFKLYSIVFKLYSNCIKLYSIVVNCSQLDSIISTQRKDLRQVPLVRLCHLQPVVQHHEHVVQGYRIKPTSPPSIHLLQRETADAVEVSRAVVVRHRAKARTPNIQLKRNQRLVHQDVCSYVSSEQHTRKYSRRFAGPSKLQPHLSHFLFCIRDVTSSA